MFVRQKVVNGRNYYAVVENRRVSGKIRQRQIASLGRHSTVTEALEAKRSKVQYWRDHIEFVGRKWGMRKGRSTAKRYRAKIEKYERQIYILEDAERAIEAGGVVPNDVKSSLHDLALHRYCDEDACK